MKQRINNISLQGKMSIVYISANFFVLLFNIILLMGINTMSQQMDTVYQENRQLNQLKIDLYNVQNSMTEYLNVKSSDSLENYYRYEQAFNSRIQEMSNEVTDAPLQNMERNIRNMSLNYIDMTSQTIEAKRGRNVSKYKGRYEKATSLYEYIDTYISSLNDEQFKISSENFNLRSSDFRSFETIGIWMIIIVIILNVAVTILLSRTIISPLKKLAKQANDIAKGNFEVELLSSKSNDEIGVVTNAFNKMILSIKDYIEKLRKSMEVEQDLKEKELRMETHLKDAQLKYLQAQINPHFLFNTLNAGAQLAMLESADKTYDYIQNMAEFFRYNVRKGDSIVSIREELKQIDHYIYILNVRFSGEIGYEKQVDESLLDAKMPGMILQPIIENCVNHGIREMEGKGKIELKVFSIDNMICISIKDNGIGISKEKIEEILSSDTPTKPRTQSGNGVGMDNVIARLRLFTNDELAIDIRSEGEGMGTQFLIYLNKNI